MLIWLERTVGGIEKGHLSLYNYSHTHTDPWVKPENDHISTPVCSGITYVIDEVREWPVRQRQQLKIFPQASFSFQPLFIILSLICNSEMEDKSIDETMAKILILPMKSEHIKTGIESHLFSLAILYYATVRAGLQWLQILFN